MKLPTRPTKKNGFALPSFQGESVEVDAVQSVTLRAICNDCMVTHIDNRALTQLREVEELKRTVLEQIVQNLGTAL